MRLFASILLFFILSTPSWATTYYVRNDGGVASRCTGLVDATDPGSGTAQPCAWKSFDVAIGIAGGTTNFSGGDTVILDNVDRSVGSGQAQYQIGWTPTTGTYGGTCSSGTTYNCYGNMIPSGPDASHPTKIYGKGYANCPSTLSSRAQIWTTQRAPYAFGVGSNVEIQCLEITDHSACEGSSGAGSSDGTIDGVNVQCPWTNNPGPNGVDGIHINGNKSNILIKNVAVHGLPRYGIVVGGDSETATFGDITLDNVQMNANGQGNFTTSPNMYSMGVGHPLTFKNGSTFDWAGCGERYPLQSSTLVDSSNVHHCSSQGQSIVADGIAFGNSGSGITGDWTFDRIKVRWNTQDGIDTLHGSANGTIKITRSLFEGNAGDPIKINASTSYVENNKFMDNCGFFHDQTFTSTKDQAGLATGFDHCRPSSGNGLAYVLHVGDNHYFYNNTVVSNSYIGMLTCGSSCDATTHFYSKNNIYRGGRAIQDDTHYNGAGGNAQVTLHYAGGNCSTDAATSCTGFTITRDGSDVVYDYKNGSTNCSGSVCSYSDPLFTGTIYPGPWSGSGYYFGFSYADAIPISVSSPAKGLGTAALSYQGGSNDYNNYPQNSPIDSGALQYNSTQTCWANGYSCTSDADCCTSTCNLNICGYVPPALGSYLYNITPIGSIKFQ